MKVLTKDKCKECDGAGLVAHPDWIGFHKADNEYKKAHGEFMDSEQVDKWFFDRGYSSLPPEEPQCGECEGVGEIERWIDVKELFQNPELLKP